MSATRPWSSSVPGTDSGTYDYFTEAVNGEEGVIRTDYNNVGENDNAAVNGVAGDRRRRWPMSAYSFVRGGRASRLKALEIDGGDGCVAPTVGDRPGRQLHAARPAAVHLPVAPRR